MAKKKGGGGGGESKKSVQKKKEKAIEDKTFGLKNKNKSKKVQQQIQSIAKNVMNSGDPKQRKLEEQRRKAKAEAKARAKAQKEEQNALFGEALLAVQKKSKHTDQKSGKVEAKGRDADDDEKNKGNSRAMKMMYQMDAQEMSDKLKEDVSSDSWLLIFLRFAACAIRICRTNRRALLASQLLTPPHFILSLSERTNEQT